MFKNMKLGIKVLAGFIVITLIAGAIGVVGSVNIRKIQNADAALFEKMTEPIHQIGIVGMCFHRVRVNLRDAIATDNQEKVLNFIKRVTELDEISRKNLDEYEKTLFTDAGRKQYAELRQAIANYGKHQARIVELIKQDNKKEAAMILYGEGGAAARVVIDLIDKNVEHKAARAKETVDGNATLAN